ncbi:LOW QUALITY PROTEIN: centrosomal protein of 95 kDa-like [Gigantopelta aegis]|uniref:LOW QUALITY PROTEIN: centrosomal protein of 95 kDa-like n=1 Tax=Gigantopelta aegis TaxID=1735272 RepID=UPI001B88CED6|nr:LOW QUALITY PROTEIN: centrosomal protein of 95 kDa-like [Gigantopelta aegis]
MEKSVPIPNDKDLVELANGLLRQFHDGIRLQCVDDISAAFFVMVFEGLFSEPLKTIIRKPITREDEIHNAQVVIDTLATDVIHDQLPHIRGLDIVKGNRVTISNLLEIFQGLSEYLLQDIEVELSSDNRDFQVERSVVQDDRNSVRSPLIDEEILRRELRWDEEPVAGYQIRRRDDTSKGDNLNHHAGRSRKEAWAPTNGVKDVVIQDVVIQSSAADRQTDQGPIQSHRPLSTDNRVPDRLTELDKLSQEAEVQKRQLEKDENVNNDSTDRHLLTMNDLSDSQQPRSARFNHVGVRPAVDPQVHMVTQGNADLPGQDRRAPNVHSGLVSSAASVSMLSGQTHTKITSTTAPSTVTSTTQPITVTSSDGNSSGFSASLPLPSKRQENINESCRFRATIGGPSSAKVSSSYTEKHGYLSQKPPHHRPRPVPNIDRAPTEQSEPRSQLTGEAMSPSLARDRPSAHRLNSPTTEQSRVQAERPYEYSRRIKGLSSSYDNLQNLVSQTAALVRHAVATSPIRLRAERETDLIASPFNTQVGRNADIHYRSRLGGVLSAEEGDLASDLNIPSHLQTRHADLTSLSSPGRGVRKVSFLDNRSTSSGGDRSRSFHTSKETSPIRVNVQKKKTRPKSASAARHGIYTERDNLSDSETDSPNPVYRRRPHEEVIEDVLSSDTEQNRYTSDVRRRTRAKPGVTGQRRASRNKQVNFTESTKKPVSSGVLAETRRFLNKENIAHSKKTKYLRDIYSEDYTDFFDEAFEELGKTRATTKETEAQYKKKVLSGGKTTRHKNVLKPKGRVKPLGVIPVIKKSRVTKPTVCTKVRKHSASSGGPPQRRGSLTVDDEEDLLPLLLEEFPYLYLSESTWHELWRQGISQIDRLTRAYEEKRRRKSKAQEQMEEAEKKHTVLTNIVKKQIEHTRRLREIKDRQKQQIAFRNKVHEKRIQSSRARRYYDEYQVRMRAKMLKRRTREEMIFKNLFKEGLDIQKDRIKEIRQYAREKRRTDAEKRQNEIDSLENYYRDQFEMLAEKVAQERKDLVVRDTAQQKVLDQMKKELRKKMEKEIQNFQDQLFRDEDDAYFRQLDADRLKHELHMAKYQTKI